LVPSLFVGFERIAVNRHLRRIWHAWPSFSPFQVACNRLKPAPQSRARLLAIGELAPGLGFYDVGETLTIVQDHPHGLGS